MAYLTESRKSRQSLSEDDSGHKIERSRAYITIRIRFTTVWRQRRSQNTNRLIKVSIPKEGLQLYIFCINMKYNTIFIKSKPLTLKNACDIYKATCFMTWFKFIEIV